MERDNSAPASAAAERRPPEVAPARGAHPSSPVGTELTEAEIAEVLAAFSRADAGQGSTSRKLGPGGVRTFLAELQRDPSIASVLAKNDFPYHGHGPGAPRIEREYWLQVSLSSLASRDGFVILHVHYAGEWKISDDQATFDRKRSTITQINARHIFWRAF